MSTSLKKYFPAGTPVKWSASAENFFPSSGELILNDDTTLNIELKHNFSHDYWVVVEANNYATSIDRVQYFRVHTKNYGTLSLENLPERGERFYGIRKSDYPDLQWNYIVYDFHNGTGDHPMSYSSFKQMQVDFGNQEITGQRFPIRTINFWQNPAVEFPYARLEFDDLYIYGGDGIQGYDGIVYLHANSIKIFSKVPADVRFTANANGKSEKSFTDSIYVQNPTGFTTANRMFSGLGRCSVNIEDFDFSNINNVVAMFNSAYFEGVDNYPFFDTSHVKDMSYMFGNSFETTKLLNNIPLYDTSNVTNMTGMFNYRLINPILPNFNTSKVTNMDYMFEGSTINSTLPNWDTSNVTNMGAIFRYATINSTLPNWDTSNVTDMSDMFYKSVINSTLPNWDTSNVTDMRYMFLHAEINSTIPNFDISNVTDMSSMFADTNIDSIPDWDLSKVIDMSGMFADCKKLTDVRIDMNACTSANGIFEGCTSLNNLYISNLKASTDLSDCPLTYDSMKFIINNLQEVTDKTISFKSTFSDPAGISVPTALVNIATNKGWTVTLV